MHFRGSNLMLFNINPWVVMKIKVLRSVTVIIYSIKIQVETTFLQKKKFEMIITQYI